MRETKEITYKEMKEDWEKLPVYIQEGFLDRLKEQLKKDLEKDKLK
jgi:hypothetical protein